MKRLSSLFFAALFVLALGGLGGCGGSSTPPVASELTVENFRFSRLEDGRRLFTGQIYNPTDRAVPGVQIKVSLLDADNRQISSTVIAVRGVAARDSTSFRQPFDSDQEASGARVQSLTVL